VFFPLGIPIFAKDGKNTILSLIFHALQIGVILWECTRRWSLENFYGKFNILGTTGISGVCYG